jgi:hypothetical protein
MAERPATRSLAITVMVMAGGFLGFWFYEPGPTLNLKPYEALGRVLADEALKLRRNEGRILVLNLNTASFASPAFDAHFRGLVLELGKSGQKVATTNRLKLDPLRVLTVPPGDFFEILRRTREGDVIISFLGPPMLSDLQLIKLPPKRASVLAACTGNLPKQVNLRQLFDRKLLHAAVISRNPPLPKPGSKASVTSWFNHLFQLITPANLAELPPPTPNAR